MKTCSCSLVPDVCYAQHTPDGWIGALQLVAHAEWKSLQECTDCKSLWVLGIPDMGNPQAVFRIEEEAGWEAIDKASEFKELFLELNGGLSDLPCIKIGCSSMRVGKFRLCLEHLWALGWRI